MDDDNFFQIDLELDEEEKNFKYLHKDNDEGNKLFNCFKTQIVECYIDVLPDDILKLIGFQYPLNYQIEYFGNVSKKWRKLFHSIKPVPDWLERFDTKKKMLKYPYFIFYQPYRPTYLFDLSLKTDDKHVSTYSMRYREFFCTIDIESKTIWTVDYNVLAIYKYKFLFHI